MTFRSRASDALEFKSIERLRGECSALRPTRTHNHHGGDLEAGSPSPFGRLRSMSSALEPGYSHGYSSLG
jgi:hypothetical protein